MSSRACRGACPEPGRRNLQIPRLVALGRNDKKGTTSFLGFYHKWPGAIPLSWSRRMTRMDILHIVTQDTGSTRVILRVSLRACPECSREIYTCPERSPRDPSSTHVILRVSRRIHVFTGFLDSTAFRAK